MITVLIVDDEPLVRKGLCETINWKEYGFEIIGEASDGESGLEKYVELCPDIIITDIRMKRVDGLAFIDNLKKIDTFDSKIVIISAYDEFNYVKRALENKVAAYILKPIQEKELMSVMLHLRSEIKEKRDNKRIIDEAKGQVLKYRNLFLKELFEGNINDVDEIKEKFEVYDIEKPQNEYTVACIKIDDMMSVTENTKQLQFDLVETLKYCKAMSTVIRFESCVISEGYMVLLILHHDDNYTYTQTNFSPLIDFFSSLKEQFETITNRTLSIGYSLGHTEIKEICVAYNEAKKALAHKSFVGKNSIIDYDVVPKVMNSALIMPYEDIEAILNMINNNNHIGVKSMVHNFFCKIKQDPSIDIESVKDVVIEMSIVILRLHFRNYEEMNDVFGYSVIPYQEIKELENVSQIEGWFSDMIKRIFDNLQPKSRYDYVSLIKDIVKNRFTENLTIEDMAEEIHISPYYLMHIFKKDMGMTFNQYLTKFRVDKAIELMQQNEYRVYEIANMVGYSDAAYFSYIFKKMTGHSPKKSSPQS